MDKIVLLPNTQKDPTLALTKQVLSVLKSFCSRIYLEDGIASQIDDTVATYSMPHFPKDAELLLVIGGDGSMLHAAPLAMAADIPLLGINMGRLGYLTSLEPSELSLLSHLSEGAYTEKCRMTLDVYLKKVDGDEIKMGTALNDAVVEGAGHLADLRLYDKNRFLDYRAGGLIVSTPTGSTAYSLSAGGPVIDEAMDAICVTPICPRSFFSRSILFCEDTVLRVVYGGDRKDALRVSIDGCVDFSLLPREEIVVRRSEKGVRILFLKPRDLLDVLCTKMNMQHF